MSDPRRAILALLVSVPLTLTACGGGGATAGGGTVPDVSGTVTAEAANRAVLALCGIAGETDLGTATATFYDRAHETLHAIAAAAEQVDRPAAAALLTAKSRVEADLEQQALPEGFGADVAALIAATGEALEALGLPTPPCPA